MDQDFTQIAFLLTVITVTVLLLVLLVVNLLLGSRNRKLKHLAELQMMESRQKAEVATIRAEVTEATLADVARDLHDEAGQLLTFSILQLENTASMSDTQKIAALSEIKQSVRDALESIRSISKGMSPDFVKEAGFVASIELLFDRVTKRTPVKTLLVVTPGFQLHASVNPVIIFRILRECITNAIRHGHAHDIHISIRSFDHTATITIHDNGTGIHEDPSHANGQGMKTMQHYASLLGGTLLFSNNPAGGTLITLTIPNPR